jgi:hypothetical protein
MNLTNKFLPIRSIARITTVDQKVWLDLYFGDCQLRFETTNKTLEIVDMFNNIKRNIDENIRSKIISTSVLGNETN